MFRETSRIKQLLALGPAPQALISARQWLSVLRSGSSKKTHFALVFVKAVGMGKQPLQL